MNWLTTGRCTEDTWAQLLTAEDQRGLTPLFWSNVAPYGEIRLNMARRLTLRTDPPRERPS